MNEIADSVGASGRRAPADDEDGVALERRLLRSMYVIFALAVVITAFLAPWRVLTGLLLGGVLSFFNHRWLRGSLRAVFGGQSVGGRPRLSAARYVLRYFVVGSIIAAAYMFDIISIVATLSGLCLFVAAVMVEAFVQLYFAVVYREET
ncbi:MAG: ATP synthase subunit I [Pyrinomonadaceae bacterium]|nr:ATP synthase subunit I [Pyrinomonadaceae bacterium]